MRKVLLGSNYTLNLQRCFITAVNSLGGVSALAYQLAFGLSAVFAVCTLILAIWKVR